MVIISACLHAFSKSLDRDKPTRFSCLIKVVAEKGVHINSTLT